MMMIDLSLTHKSSRSMVHRAAATEARNAVALLPRQRETNPARALLAVSLV